MLTVLFPQVEVVKKKKSRKVDVPVTAKVWGALSPPDLQKATEEEYEMQLQDKIIEETKEKKNAVEAYVYSMRNKVRAIGRRSASPQIGDACLITKVQDACLRRLFSVGKHFSSSHPPVV